LIVPIEMGNEYQHRIGEIDWVFTAEQHNDPEPEKPGKTPDTGDSTNLMLYGGMLSAAGALMVLMVKRRQQN